MDLEKAKSLLTNIPVPESCSCQTCVSMCLRPCWPTPVEANHLLDQGYAKRLMKDRWYGEDTDILCGANPGHEGLEAPEVMMFQWPDPRVKGCVLLENNLCTIHHCKPIEGRLAIHNPSNMAEYESVHEAVATLWNTDEGRAVVARWEELVR